LRYRFYYPEFQNRISKKPQTSQPRFRRNLAIGTGNMTGELSVLSSMVKS